MIIEEILETSTLRYFDSRREDKGTLFVVVPLNNPSLRKPSAYGAIRIGDKYPTRVFESQTQAIREIARHFGNNRLGIEIDFDIIN